MLQGKKKRERKRCVDTATHLTADRSSGQPICPGSTRKCTKFVYRGRGKESDFRRKGEGKWTM